MSQNDWDIRYLQLAAHVATWSKDPRRKVGAVLVRDNRIIASGFNGLPEGVGDTFHRLHRKATKLCMVVHAEENALLSAGDRARGATLYVHGLPVCARCATSIIQAKVSRVVAKAPLIRGLSETALEAVLDVKPEEMDWEAMGELAVRMFHDARVSFVASELDAERSAFLKLLPLELSNDRRTGKHRRKKNLMRKGGGRSEDARDQETRSVTVKYPTRPAQNSHSPK